MQITSNITSAYHVQHVACHVVQMDSSAIKFDRVEIAFSLASFDWLKPSNGKREEKTPDDELQKMPYTEVRKFKPQSRSRTLALVAEQVKESDVLTSTPRAVPIEENSNTLKLDKYLLARNAVLSAAVVVVCWLLNVPATCKCISGTDLLNFTCCHNEIEVADQSFHLTQSQDTDTGPTSPSTDPLTPGAWQGSHWSANFEVTGMTRPRKKSRRKRDSNPGSSALEADALTTRPTRRPPAAGYTQVSVLSILPRSGLFPHDFVSMTRVWV